MKNKMKYSSSAIFLIALLIMRTIGQFFSIFWLLPKYNNPIAISILIGFTCAIVYLIALAGIAMRTKWGLVMTIFIAVFDIICLSIVGFNLGAVAVDLILIILALNIIRRV